MKKIIVIDDDPQILKLLGYLLRKNQYDVTEVSDGKKAMELLKNNDYDLAICDIIMPEAEGIETIQFMHAKFPRLKILAISGNVRKLYLEMAHIFGAHETMHKPIDIHNFLITVRQMLQY